MPDTPSAPLSLFEASTRFFATLQPEVASEYQSAVSLFIQWFGADRQLRDLRPSDIERFAEVAQQRNAIGSMRRLEPVHAFLSYASREGWTPVNLSTNLRLRRTGSSDRSGAAQLGGAQTPMTPEGYAARERELEELRAQRPKIAEDLRTAMADKDFRENSPLDAARERQAHVEARIRELEQMLKHAVIVESGSGPSNITHVGCRVVVRDLDNGDERNFTLVSPGEVNPREGKISVASPVGRALLERAPGEEVEVAVPRGRLRLRIESIQS